MKKILILNGGKNFGHSKGELNDTMTTVAKQHLLDLNHEVKVTSIDAGYDIGDEINKWMWADIIIQQTPAWWMGVPWIVKKYIDEVFTIGHGRLYQSDGRSRQNSDHKYGSGGLLQEKQYMLSVTWNAPTEAFTDPNQFFEGAGVDGVYLAMHKAHQFLGMKPLTTFMSNDVIKNPTIDHDIKRYKEHLDTFFTM
ncbi:MULTISPECIES: NAD(P)H-dependent oxidoreductase [Vibrio]|uniref:Flavodoxin family protein n=1 Tax=Vibrio casei TaxID=673372 RepID=A0A368LNM7_9VIBR|nr:MULTISPECIES: NAD(P)H-dependent oxidoreductase [Vibrio]RCS73482.1 flavodoxin family protein [Vibrio casei]SJN22259.1 Modulator of drug activity B [Vibrio casei]HBV76942.1 flavodoxin family protein [Vibrio sp.]